MPLAVQGIAAAAAERREGKQIMSLHLHPVLHEDSHLANLCLHLKTRRKACFYFCAWFYFCVADTK